MRKAECKGRTLVLKVKLHTYEVLTRQVVTPRAICAAGDLYKYALPILAKLEQERPGMKLRLMGLRCTHLVSTKKPDTRAFFGLRPSKTEADVDGSNGTSKQEASNMIMTRRNKRQKYQQKSMKKRKVTTRDSHEDRRRDRDGDDVGRSGRYDHHAPAESEMKQVALRM